MSVIIYKISLINCWVLITAINNNYFCAKPIVILRQGVWWTKTTCQKSFDFDIKIIKTNLKNLVIETDQICKD